MSEIPTRSQRNQQGKKKKAVRNKGKRPNKMRNTLIILLAVVLLIGGSIGGAVWNMQQPVDKANTSETILNFEQDENVRNIGAALKDAGIIKSPYALRLKAKAADVSYIAKPGKYSFNPSMTLDEIVAILKEGRTAYDYVMVIRDGMNMDEVLDDFSVNSDDFMQNQMRVNDVNFISELRTQFPALPEEILGEGFRYPLEGFLANGEYYIKEDTSIEEYITLAVSRFQDEYTARNMEQKLAERGKTLFEVVTMAALVRGEVFAGDFENQKIVAGVFNNRLASDMLMGSDVTVGYAIGLKDTNYTQEQLDNESPYNTYVTPGLPRGPINNPSFDTIEAVMDPIPSEFYYFIADICDDEIGEFGQIYYSVDMAQHDETRYKYLACIY